MGSSIRALHLIVVLIFFSIYTVTVFAGKKSYIVYLGAHNHGEKATEAEFKAATNSHYELLEQFLESREKAQEAIIYSYTKHINGFAAILKEDEAIELSKHPRVISLFRNEAMQLHTTRSWDLLLLKIQGKVPASSIWTKAKFGKDAIIGNLDTGVWPESKSFNDQGMGPIPSKWRGFCDNNTKAGVPCNRKLIGARCFNLGSQFESKGKNMPGISARDEDGHGTHTLSTAGGRSVPNASIFGLAAGTASGGAPAARVAAYKVCWGGGCYGADILAGYDAAIDDGVDVITISLGGNAADYVNDPIALGAFHAVAKGILVVGSGGNQGPTEGTVSNTAPWILSAGATSLDRQFLSWLTLGNKHKIKGFSLSDKRLPKKLYPLIKAVDGSATHATAEEATVCYYGSLDARKVNGKIVICLNGENNRFEKGEEVIRAGGVGVILVNDEYNGNALTADAQLLPQVNIAYEDGLALDSYMNTTKSPVGYISAPETTLGVKPTPIMADFSSRGPNLIAPQILKPDVTAPGYNILAAYSEAVSPTLYTNDTRRVEFNLLSGTSMACPHIGGIAGLLKTMYPTWSPAAIKSAIMTTARTRDNTGKPIKNYDGTKATPLAYGSGNIRPNRAMDPGLVYDLTITDYLNFICSLGYNATAMALFNGKPYKCPEERMDITNLNYPSITIPDLNGSLTVTRTVKNVGLPGRYKVRVEAPMVIQVSIKPEVLEFNKVGEEKTFQVSFKSMNGSVGPGYVFGMIIWSDGKHYVRTPLAINAVS